METEQQNTSDPSFPLKQRNRRRNAIGIMREAILSTAWPKLNLDQAQKMAEAAYQDLRGAGYVE